MTREINIPLTCRQLAIFFSLLPPIVTAYGYFANNVWLFAIGIAFLIVEATFIGVWLTFTYPIKFSCRCDE